MSTDAGSSGVERSAAAEEIRRRLADAWGEMGAAWGIAPAVARVHAYLLARAEPLTEREVREALGLSHRATSLALAESVTWGLVERVAMSRRIGRRGPVGVAYRAVGDHWLWLGRIIAERKRREGDPIVAILEGTAADASRAAADLPADAELARVRDWLARFLEFVRLFDRAIGLVTEVEPSALERALRLIEAVPDQTVLRLVRLIEAVPDDDLLPLVTALSRLSPAAARRAMKLMVGAARAAAG